MDRIICNIPHAGRLIPEWAMEDFLIPQSKLEGFAAFMADKDVDKLFGFVPEESKTVAALSRVVLDTERFRNDSDEPMSKLGMGLYYTNDDKGNIIRRKGATYARCLELYDEYHKELEDKVARCVEENGTCLILDCHSFHDAMEYTGFSPADFPDVCLGFNGEHPGDKVLLIKEIFEACGYSVKLNIPFGGALVPLSFWNDARVDSVMIELNRRIYCGSSADFNKVQMICRKIYSELA